MINMRDYLGEISQTLLSMDSSPGELYNACARLKELLLHIAVQIDASPTTTQNIATNSGMALDTQWAARCIEDIYRTRAFCAGLCDAIKDKLAQNPDKTIQVLYAGSGPFATLVLPATTLFTPQQVQFTLVELNPESQDILENVLEQLELKAYVKAIEKCDAVDYTIASPDQFDIVISETMQAGLKDEPQVAISHKIMGQLNKDAVLIPQEVALHLFLVNGKLRSDYKMNKELTAPYYKDLGPVYVLNKETIAQNQELFEREFPEVEFPEVNIDLPKGAQRKYDSVMLCTKLNTYKDHFLDIDHSGLTTLLTVVSFGDSMMRYKGISAQYISDENPGLDCMTIN